MEDAHTVALQLEEGSNETASFFAVYDGHGGKFHSPTVLVHVLTIALRAQVVPRPGLPVRPYTRNSSQSQLIARSAGLRR
jgi:hypothetical protein